MSTVTVELIPDEHGGHTRRTFQCDGPGCPNRVHTDETRPDPPMTLSTGAVVDMGEIHVLYDWATGVSFGDEHVGDFCSRLCLHRFLFEDSTAEDAWHELFGLAVRWKLALDSDNGVPDDFEAEFADVIEDYASGQRGLFPPQPQVYVPPDVTERELAKVWNR